MTTCRRTKQKAALAGSFLLRFIGNFQRLRLAQELAEIVAEGGVFIAGADTLVHHHAQGHDLLVEIAAHVVRHGLAHADKHAGGAEFIAVVVDVAGLDGGQVGDEHAGVKGAQVDDLPGQQAVLVQMVGQPDHELGQAGDGEHHLGELVGAVLLLRLAVDGDGIGDLLVDGENSVLGLQIDLQRRLIRAAVGPLFQDDKGDAEMVALIEMTVDHKPVELGVGLIGLVIGGDDHRHVVDADPSAPFFADIGLDALLVDVFGDGVPGIVPLGHDVGNGCHDGWQVLYSLSVRAHEQFLDSVCIVSIIDHMAADCKLLFSFPNRCGKEIFSLPFRTMLIYIETYHGLTTSKPLQLRCFQSG